MIILSLQNNSENRRAISIFPAVAPLVCSRKISNNLCKVHDLRDRSKKRSECSSDKYVHAGRYTTSSRSSVDNGGDVSECYDVPPRAVPVIPSPASSPSPAPSCYDIPRPPTSCTPISNCSGGSGVTPLDCYDVPRPLQPLTPSSSASSLTNDGSLSGSNRYVIHRRWYTMARQTSIFYFTFIVAFQPR